MGVLAAWPLFFWASYGGLWHIHKTGNELAALSAHPEWRKIEDHLFDGVPDRGGIDLKAVTSKSWSEHQASYSEFILTQGAILYEEWCGELARMVQTPNKKIKAETFQFVSGSTSSKWTNWSALDAPGIIQESNFLKNKVQPGLLSIYNSNISNLDAILKWYRFYKEVRNSIVHHGGVSRAEDVAAYANAIATPLRSLGMKRDFAGGSPVEGSKFNLSITDAVLLLGVIQRIVYAFDAKYCHTAQAEADLKSRIQEALQISPAPYEATPSRKASWIKKFLLHRGGISPASISAAEQWLKANGLVNIKTI